MKCILCNKESTVFTSWGFCPECIAWKGHRGCQEEINKREADKKDG